MISDLYDFKNSLKEKLIIINFYHFLKIMIYIYNFVILPKN